MFCFVHITWQTNSSDAQLRKWSSGSNTENKTGHAGFNERRYVIPFKGIIKSNSARPRSLPYVLTSEPNLHLRKIPLLYLLSAATENITND